MTPSARVAAAIECLDRHLAGNAVEKVLTTWARQNRFAGSKDRRAVRDLVFDALRNRRSYAYVGGGETGRQMLLGAGQLSGTLDEMFDGEGYGAGVVTAEERARFQELADAPAGVRLDVQDWVIEMAEARGMPDAAEIFAAFKARAPVFLRVNLLRSTPDAAMAALESEGIVTARHPLAATALQVLENAPRVAQSRAFQDGLVEVQDAASQACVEEIKSHVAGARVLDFCAGGGGKALAMAAYGATRVDAFDANAGRMRDLPERARRAGARISPVAVPGGEYDLVFCDCPCSGSGAWRRQVEAKWTLSPARLADLTALQDDILDRAAGHVSPSGRLVYATCSIFPQENTERVEAFFQRHPAWHSEVQRQISPLEGGDGFFVAVLSRR